jgi:predicted enzyme related to lactoylglutathione lyase
MNNNSYQDELDRYFQVVHNKEVPERILYKANLSKVRTKLKHKAFIELNDHLARFFYEYFTPETWFGFNLLDIHLVSKSGVQVCFLLPDQPTQAAIFQKPYSGEGVIFSLEVEDADAALASAKSKSLNIVLELRSEDWGQRHFCIQDPNGVYLDIVQSFEPTEEYRSGYVS